MASLALSPRRRLVGQPLLYAISVFASLGVFLVSATGCGVLTTRLIWPSSSDMTKGILCAFDYPNNTSDSIRRVMSGIITGPYFKAFFNDPSDLELGTMVAVLEVGAFGQ